MRFGSMQLFQFRGITVELHPTFYLLPLLVGLEGWADDRGRGLVENLWAVTLVYTCLVLHEFGHALTAKGLGLPVKHIVLLPIGGMAMLQKMPRNPLLELIIVAAGPLVNFAIAGICLLLLGHWPHGLLEAEVPGFHLGGILRFLLLANLVLGCFNLLPAFPMDGGRVLRALLAFKMDYLRATRWALRIGRVVAVVGIGLALWGGVYTLAALFIFILFVGNWEYRQLLQEEPIP